MTTKARGRCLCCLSLNSSFIHSSTHCSSITDILTFQLQLAVSLKRFLFKVSGTLVV